VGRRRDTQESEECSGNKRVRSVPEIERPNHTLTFAEEVCENDVESCRHIGLAGLEVIKALPAFKKNDFPINVLTHCNAGWLACVDWGTALSPIYAAHAEGIDIHVWVDETRPRNQGANLTSFELGQQGVPFHLISDNAGGHLMQEGKVDLCLVGADRVTRNGDVANKIGTYLKALAARDNEVPFYAAFPGTTIDWSTEFWKNIPIEERSEDEVTLVRGRLEDGTISSVSITPDDTPAANPAFDVTPSRLITGLVTERGIANADRNSLTKLYS
jgi:methylthioribose-1-phosphate isomerase